jgi:hypothetical protein
MNGYYQTRKKTNFESTPSVVRAKTNHSAPLVSQNVNQMSDFDRCHQEKDRKVEYELRRY